MRNDTIGVDVSKDLDAHRLADGASRRFASVKLLSDLDQPILRFHKPDNGLAVRFAASAQREQVHLRLAQPEQT